MGKITISAEDAKTRADEAIRLQKEKEFELISAFIAKRAGEGSYGIKIESLYKETREALKLAGFKVVQSGNHENFYWYISWAGEEEKKGKIVQFPRE